MRKDCDSGKRWIRGVLALAVGGTAIVSGCDASRLRSAANGLGAVADIIDPQPANPDLGDVITSQIASWLDGL